MKKLFFFIGICLLMNCSNDLELSVENLEEVLNGKETVLDNVIACAASNENSETLVSIFLYPREGATNLKCYATSSVIEDKDDWSLYAKVDLPLEDVFNVYLMKFEGQFEQEKSIVLTFEEDGKIHLSNPIRLKHLSKPTEYLPQNVTV